VFDLCMLILEDIADSLYVAKIVSIWLSCKEGKFFGVFLWAFCVCHNR